VQSHLAGSVCNPSIKTYQCHSPQHCDMEIFSITYL